MLEILNAFIDGIKKTVKEYNQKKSEKTDEITESDGKKALIDALGEIEEAYKKTPYKTYDGVKMPNFEEIKYDAPTDEDILKAVEDIYGRQKEESVTKLKANAQEKVKGLEENKEKASETAEKSAAKIAAMAEKAKTEAENQALKRGIGRSSIILEELNDIDKSALSATGEVYGDLQKQIADIDAKIVSLNDELGAALDKLDVDTAVKINDKVKELKDEREKKVMEVAKYNNELKEKEAKAAADIRKSGVDVTEENSDEYADKNSQKIKRLYAYYYDFGSDAVAEVEKDRDFIENQVGENGYRYLLNTLTR